jgi:hypothetical protein
MSRQPRPGHFPHFPSTLSNSRFPNLPPSTPASTTRLTIPSSTRSSTLLVCFVSLTSIFHNVICIPTRSYGDVFPTRRLIQRLVTIPTPVSQSPPQTCCPTESSPVSCMPTGFYNVFPTQRLIQHFVNLSGSQPPFSNLYPLRWLGSRCRSVGPQSNIYTSCTRSMLCERCFCSLNFTLPCFDMTAPRHTHVLRPSCIPSSLSLSLFH